MENAIICLDTSVLFEYFRKKKKEDTFFIGLIGKYAKFEITSITEFEIKYGINLGQSDFWNSLLKEVNILPFDGESANIAVEIHKKLKKSNQQLALPDLFIAATAKKFNRPLATMNVKHFERIEGLDLVFPHSIDK
jgi:predicted nucleic acid-binding protein